MTHEPGVGPDQRGHAIDQRGDVVCARLGSKQLACGKPATKCWACVQLAIAVVVVDPDIFGFHGPDDVNDAVRGDLGEVETKSVGAMLIELNLDQIVAGTRLCLDITAEQRVKLT